MAKRQAGEARYRGMKTPRARSLLLLLLSILLVVVAPAAALHAQLPKVFVASFGNDANDGSRGNPKRNFQAAHNAVASNGQIVVLDTAGYGALNITKSLTITVPPGVNGFVTVPGNTPSAISINAAFTDSVVLRGLIIEGGGNRTTETANTNYGIRVVTVGVLTVEDCTIRNFYDGLAFFPMGPSFTNTGFRLFVHNTNVTNCRYGIDVEANEFNRQFALIANSRLENNGDALYAGATGGAPTPKVIVDYCYLGYNGIALHGASDCRVGVSNSIICFNDSTIVLGAQGANVGSYGNNRLIENTAGAGFTFNISPN